MVATLTKRHSWKRSPHAHLSLSGCAENHPKIQSKTELGSSHQPPVLLGLVYTGGHLTVSVQVSRPPRD
ncbi:hypothetical protein AAFF_G00005480 [Aldrovandia affinis]|uniref:Uncharacterized protein n=1 Tax=Aldrovandia affinis TaxID=143900 RepID=A0AAD7TDL9_9TELE|nr:hypothetical protein AAFF_G00005480 [Aldrovandia affinis]